jgi:hypothetical protein
MEHQEAGTQKALHMFPVMLKPKNNKKDIYNVCPTYVGSLFRIKFETPYPKREMLQYINCLCREKSKDVKCVLCEGKYPGSYKDYMVYKKNYGEKW